MPQTLCQNMNDKSGYLVLAIAVLLLAAIGWCFVTILRDEPATLSEEDVERIEQDLKDSLGPTSQDAMEHTVAATAVSQVRVMPLHPILSGFSLSPHNFPALLGLIGVIMVAGALLWCFFAPMTIGVTSVESTRLRNMDSDSLSSDAPSVILTSEEDK